MTKNKIYRVFDKKKRYKQSYSDKLSQGYSWAVDCAKIEKGFVCEDIIDEKGEKISSKIVFQENKQ